MNGGARPARPRVGLRPERTSGRPDRWSAGVDRWPGRLGAAGWTVLAWWRVHRAIRTRPLADVVVPAPWWHRPGRGQGSVAVTLALLRASCLESALVWQRWEAAGGRPRDVVVGVTRSGDRFLAHAWLDGTDPRGEFVEIHRRPAKGR